jgi:RNase P subunit RPR2
MPGNEISEKYFDGNKCDSRHSIWSWKNIDFKHNKTDFELLGKHKNVSCSDCHLVYNKGKVLNERFSSLDQGCLQCRKDFHNRQFVENGKELCEDCHTF